MAAENDLGKDKVSRLVLRMALPSMMAQFVSVLYSVVDRMYVGNIAQVGKMALAGVGICSPVVTMIGSVAFWVGIGGTPMMGIRMGKGEMKQAKRIVANGFLMLCLFAAALTALVLVFREPMLYLFGASQVTYPYAEAYFTIYVCGTVFALLSVGMNQFIIGQGFAQVGMKSVILGAVSNIVLDPVFIFGFGMGVRGAALATVLSQCLSAVYVLRFLFGSRAVIPITFGGYRLSLMGRILLMGFTPFIIIAIDNVMLISMNAVLQRGGGAQAGDMLVTCNTIVQSFMLVVTMPLGGITSGTQGILSYNFGAGRKDRVLEAQKYIARYSVCYGVLMFVLARVGGHLFIRLFTSDPVLMEQAYRTIGICTSMAIPLSIQYVIVDGFTGMGKVQLALPLSFWRKLIYFVSIFLLPALFGTEAAFYAEPISDIVGPLTSITVYLLVIRRILESSETRSVGSS